MLAFLFEYGLFLAKAVTVVAAILAVIGISVRLIRRSTPEAFRPGIKVKKLNTKYEGMERELKSHLLSDEEWKQLVKDEKKQEKEKKKKKKNDAEETKKRIFVLDFEGDISASAVDSLREEITAIATVASPKTDEVILRLESGGGSVPDYGLGASQLERLRKYKIPLTVVVDKIAASGGYKMACVADTLVAAPYALIGSIGVAAEFPNFNRLLKKHDIDYEQITAGEFKRTWTQYGEFTPKAKEKFTEQLLDIHELFKHHVQDHREGVDIDKVATGESWYAIRAKEMNLVDELQTSDDLLLSRREEADIFHIHYQESSNVAEKIFDRLDLFIKQVVSTFWKAIGEIKVS